jgi:hypothetical protein
MKIKFHVILFLRKMQDTQDRNAAITKKNSIETRDDLRQSFPKILIFLEWLTRSWWSKALVLKLFDFLAEKTEF